MQARARLSLVALAVLVAGLSSAYSINGQGRPDIQWMRGGHSETVDVTKFSPNGEMVATADYNNVKISRASDGVLLMTISFGTGSLNFSPDSQTIAVAVTSDAPGGNAIQIWRISDKSLVRSIPVSDFSSILQLNFSPDGTEIVAGLHIYNVADGSTNFYTGTVNLQMQFFSPDGQYVYGSSYNGHDSLVRWPAADPSQGATNVGAANNGYPVAISPNGQYVINDRGGDVIRVSDGVVVHSFGFSNNWVASYQFTSDSLYVAQARPNYGGTAAITLTRTSDWGDVWTVPADPSNDYGKINLAVYGQQIAVSYKNTRLLNLSDGSPIRDLTTLGYAPVISLAFSSDGQTLVTANSTPASSTYNPKGSIYLWNVADGSRRNVDFPQSVNLGIYQILITPDGQQLLTLDGYNGQPQQHIRFWNASDGTLIRDLPQSYSTGSLALSPDGQIYAAGYTFNSHLYVDLRQTSNDSVLRTLSEAGRGGTFSPNNQLFAAPGEHGGVNLYDVSSGNYLRTLNAGADGVAFSPDSQTVAVLESTGSSTVWTTTVHLFRVSDGALLRNFQPFNSRSGDFAFAPDGNTIIARGNDATLRIWRVSDGALVQTYDQETDVAWPAQQIFQIAFSPNGSRFAYGRHDATVVMANNPFALGHFTATMTASRNPAPVGQNFNYNVSVTNDGAGSSSNTTLTDVLPSLVTLTSATPSQGACAYASATRTLTCSLGTLAVSASASVQITVKPRDEGTLDNTASLSATNYATASASVNGLPAVKLVDLSVSKTDSADPIFVGDNTTYTMIVKNSNTVNNATGVTLQDTLPAGMTFVSATTTQGSLVTPPVGSTGTVTANIGTLAPNATATVTVTVKAAAAGVQSDTATVSSNEADSNTANNTSTQATTVNVSGVASLQKVLLASQVLTGGCQNTTGQVFLSSPAPAGGATVTLSSSVAGASVPASVFIQAGQTVSPTFNVTTSPVAAKQTGLITATSGPNSVSRGITINVGSGSCP